MTSSKNLIELLLWGILKSGYNGYSLDYYTSTENETGSDEGRIETSFETFYDEAAVNGFESLIKEKMAYEYPYGEMTVLPSKLAVSKLYPEVLDGADENTVKIINTEEEEETSDNKKLGIVPNFIEKNKIDESAKRGIATHMFMQFFNIERLLSNGARAELSLLFEKGYLTNEDKDRVRLREIELFTKSSLLSEMREAKNLYREFRFNVKLPAALFTTDENKKKAYEGKEILLQGVIDCIMEDADGNLHLIDYKTDRLSKEEISDKALARKTLSDKHSLQLYYYSLAIEKIFGKLPKTKRVYSLVIGDCVYLD